MGGDALGRSGQRGHVDTHFAARFGTAALISLIGVAPQLLVDDTSDGDAVQIIGDVGKDLEGASQSVLDDYLRIKPTITIDQGTPHDRLRQPGPGVLNPTPLPSDPATYAEHDLRELRDPLTSDDVNEVVINPDGVVWVEHAFSEHMVRSDQFFSPAKITNLGTHLPRHRHPIRKARRQLPRLRQARRDPHLAANLEPVP